MHTAARVPRSRRSMSWRCRPRRARSRRPAAGRPHGDRRARLPDAGAGPCRGAGGASPDGDIYYTSALGLPELRAGDRAPLPRPLRRRRSRPERVIVTAGSSAALLLVAGAARQPRRADPARRPRLSLQPPLRPHARGRAGRHPGRAGIELPAHGGADRAALAAADARRADRLAVEPHRHDASRATRCERIAAAVAARGGRLIVDEIYLGLTYDSDRPQSALCPRRRHRSWSAASPSTST